MIENSLFSVNRTEINTHADLILNDLGLSRNDLTNKDVLDVAAGAAELAVSCKDLNTRIISVDTDPSVAGYSPGYTDIDYIIADARALPFQDNLFDLVISHAGIITVLASKEDVELAIREALRVLRPDGELRFGPGSLSASMFEEGELFTPEEELTFSDTERISRVRARSFAFLRSINGEIEERDNNGELDYINYYYIMKKPS